MTTQNSAPVVTPSSLNPPPKNGAASQTQQSSEPKPASAAPVDPVAQREAALNAREEAIKAREAKYQNELKKNAQEKTGLGAKLSRLGELEKWKSEADSRAELRRLNPELGLKEDFGDNWREVVAKLGVDGVPPAGLIAAELKRFKEELRAELVERDAKTKEQTTVAEQEEIEATRARVAGDSSAFYETNAKDYPVFERLGDAKRVGQILGQRIEQHFMAHGKVLSPKEAADALESDMLGIAETAAKSEKYRDRLHGGEKAATVSPSSGVTQLGAPQSGTPRRTLSNDLTASTSGRAPARSDAERFDRAMAAYNAAATRGKS